MHQKPLQHEYSSNVQTDLCFLSKAMMTIILNNDIELNMKYLEGRSVLMENVMNGHFNSEGTKIELCFFPTNVNIWKSSRVMLMNFSPEFLITVI